MIDPSQGLGQGLIARNERKYEVEKGIRDTERKEDTNGPKIQK